MADALTATQMEILRRARDASDVSIGPFLPGLMREVSFLSAMRLVQWSGNLRFVLTTLGREYLALAEAESTQGTVPTPEPPRQQPET